MVLSNRKQRQTKSAAIQKNLPVHPPKNKSSRGGPKVTLNGDAPPLGKFLASNSKATRDKAVDALRKFLGGKAEQTDSIFEPELPEEIWEPIDPKDERLNPTELAKVYKGIFYCYWMSDKPIIQQQLAQQLADLCLEITPTKLSEDPLLNQVFITQTALSFWKGFWKTLESEWQSIDKHRQDKYLALMRRFVEAAFRILQRVNWHTKAIEMWSGILKDTIFNVADFKTPLSITYHYSDIFLDELNRVIARNPGSAAPIDQLLDPLVYGLSHARPGTATFQKTIENVFDPLFENLEYFNSNRTKKLKSSTIDIYNTFENSLRTTLSISDSTTSIAPPDNRFQQIRCGILSLLFTAGANPLCSDSNRKKIYKYWNANGGSDEVVDAEAGKQPAEE